MVEDEKMVEDERSGSTDKLLESIRGKLATLEALLSSVDERLNSIELGIAIGAVWENRTLISSKISSSNPDERAAGELLMYRLDTVRGFKDWDADKKHYVSALLDDCEEFLAIAVPEEKADKNPWDEDGPPTQDKHPWRRND